MSRQTGTKSKPRRPWEEPFLVALETSGVISHAAKSVGVGRRTVYDHLKTDAAFRGRCADALETAADNFEMEAMRRAMEGEQQPLYYKGKVVGHITRKNDAMLMYVLRNMRQWQHRELKRGRSFMDTFAEDLS